MGKFSSQAGLGAEPLAVEVTSRRAANYAAALGADEPVYYEHAAGGQLAPPMLAVALTWPLVAGLMGRVEDRLGPGAAALQVHYAETLVFHQPLAVGQRLVITGGLAGLETHRAGALATICCQAALEDGRPVFTEYNTGLVRGGEIKGETLAPPAPARLGPAFSGPPAWSTTLAIHPLLPYIYDGCTDIVFPIHTSPLFARAAGLEGIILQGTATLGLAFFALAGFLGVSSSPGRVRRLGCRFSGMVRPGETITIEGLEVKKAGGGVLAPFRVLGENGKPVLSRGELELTAD